MKNYNFVIHDAAEGDGFRRAELVGSLDSHTVVVFEKSVQDLVEGGTGTVLLDLGNLTYISSAGISALMGLKYKLQQREGELVLLKPTDKVLRVFKMLGFTSIFRIVENESAFAAPPNR
jgi:anti-anti-sigma factor